MHEQTIYTDAKIDSMYGIKLFENASGLFVMIVHVIKKLKKCAIYIYILSFQKCIF